MCCLQQGNDVENDIAATPQGNPERVFTPKTKWCRDKPLHTTTSSRSKRRRIWEPLALWHGSQGPALPAPTKGGRSRGRHHGCSSPPVLPRRLRSAPPLTAAHENQARFDQRRGGVGRLAPDLPSLGPPRATPLPLSTSPRRRPNSGAGLEAPDLVAPPPSPSQVPTPPSSPRRSRERGAAALPPPRHHHRAATTSLCAAVLLRLAARGRHCTVSPRTGDGSSPGEGLAATIMARRTVVRRLAPTVARWGQGRCGRRRLGFAPRAAQAGDDSGPAC